MIILHWRKYNNLLKQQITDSLLVSVGVHLIPSIGYYSNSVFYNIE
jgi:hypothetical protein